MVGEDGDLLDELFDQSLINISSFPYLMTRQKASAKDPVTNEDQWFKAVGHHVGIISKNLFDEVQRLFVERSNMEIGTDGKKKRKKTHYSSKKSYAGLTKDAVRV